MKAHLLAATLAVTLTPSASAAKLWNWQYSAPGISASGTATTVDTPDASGGYLVTSITGTRNGDPIIALQKTGTAIPGNEPYEVDNLLFLGPGPQMTSHGIGFALAGGGFSNPFYADFLPTPGYLEFYSTPPTFIEPSIEFSATLVPEPATISLLAFALLGLSLLRKQTSAGRLCPQIPLRSIWRF